MYLSNKKAFGIGDKVWYLCPRQVPGKQTKITDTWLGPYLITRKVAEVLFSIKQADYEGPELTAHACCLVYYRTDTVHSKSLIPSQLVMDENGDELAEEIRLPVETSRQELGIPVQLGIP